MKKTILSLLAVTVAIAFAAISQTSAQTAKPHKHQIVFENNSDRDGWDQVLGNIGNIKKAFAGEEVQVEVVCLGKGLSMLLKTNTDYAERLKKLTEEGVILSACQNSMRMRKVTTEDLLPFAGQVDSGAAQVIRRQEAGWSFLKSGS